MFIVSDNYKCAVAFFGRSGSSSFAKSFLPKEVVESFVPKSGVPSIHSLCKLCMPQYLAELYQDYSKYAVIRHPYERWQSAINHTGRTFLKLMDQRVWDVHIKNCSDTIKGIELKAYRFEAGGIENCAKDIGIPDFEKTNSTDHVITLTNDQKAILDEKYSKDIELWNSIDENGKEVYVK
jgi:hypothetical protein